MPSGCARRRSSSGARASGRSFASRNVQVNAHVLSLTGGEHLRRVAAADGNRDVSIRVLVEDDLAAPRIGEGARGDRVVALGSELQLETRAGDDGSFLQVIAIQVQLHVAEAVDRQDGRVNSRRADLRTWDDEPRERIR